MLKVGQEFILPIEPSCRVIITGLQVEDRFVKLVDGIIMNSPKFQDIGQDVSWSFTIYECAAALITQQLGYRPKHISMALVLHDNSAVKLRDEFGDFDAFEEVITRIYNNHYEKQEN
jgi:hypothetical protein